MECCKYHPLVGATYYCSSCDIHQCDSCVDDDARAGTRCFLCGAESQSLGSANNVEPFWRRLQEAFKYPLHKACIGLIAGTSLLSVIALALDSTIISLILSVISFGTLLKYSLLCLEKTAQGEMVAPDIYEAFHGGIGLVLRLLIVLVIFIVSIAVIAHFLGATIAGIAGIWILVCLPAMVIRYAATQNIVDAINPMAALRLVLSIGLPYGLLMAFIMIMMTSVGVLHELLAVLPMGAYLLQSIVSGYYMIVMFHIMGYMLFQYQRELGYVARENFAEEQQNRSDAQRLAAKIDVNLKEGNYEKVVSLYHLGFKQYPQEKLFFDRYFDFLFNCKKKQLMSDFALTYLQFALQQKRFDKLTVIYRQILLLLPDFIPQDPAVRLQLAIFFKQQGDNKSALKMLNGMHKQFPQYPDLVQAYTLMAEVLESLPNMQEQAAKCRQLIEDLKKQAMASELKEPPKTQASQNKASFVAEPVTQPVNHSASNGDLPPIDFFAKR